MDFLNTLGALASKLDEGTPGSILRNVTTATSLAENVQRTITIIIDEFPDDDGKGQPPGGPWF